MIDLSRVNRVEVIDSAGRSYIKWHDNLKVSASLQDDGRTLKVFIACAQPTKQGTSKDSPK